ncbi:MAG: non-reducing end alpha-L-arabinofuranosidase family hydrolase [Gammaproteobacteria bacterium]|nr:non-reducing end alpha-L-arabinofuranosidase family hydrolase [Gammaproteobacteria bacterium]
MKRRQNGEAVRIEFFIDSVLINHVPNGNYGGRWRQGAGSRISVCGLPACTLKGVMLAVLLLFVISVNQLVIAQEISQTTAVADVLAGKFRWMASAPLLAVNPKQLPASPDNPWIAVKDPSIVWHNGKWHLFCSLRKQKGGQGRIRIGYLSFSDWKEAPLAKWHVLELADDYHGAPQIFYFEPQRKWYLIYQAIDKTRSLPYGPHYSTNDDISNPSGWTLPEPLYTVKPGQNAGLDFWVICDDTKAHLFFTTLDGRMRRAETRLADFPNRGWTTPEVVLKADIFEASHIYKLKGLDKYLSLIEAENGPRRYYKAFLADRLDGQWLPLATSRERLFASPVNVTHQGEPWTESYSHGELIRTGVDQRLEVDPADLQFLFQGVSDEDRAGKGYGAIPWRLGILRQIKEQ